MKFNVNIGNVFSNGKYTSIELDSDAFGVPSVNGMFKNFHFSFGKKMVECGAG